jgi:hypothetical protein
MEPHRGVQRIHELAIVLGLFVFSLPAFLVRERK